MGWAGGLGGWAGLGRDDVDTHCEGWLGGVGWQEVVRGGGLVLSLKVFNWMKAQRCYRAQTAVYNDLCHLAARHRSVTRARHLFYEMLEWR